MIGIDASRAFAKERSGVGEYARELIEALIDNNYLFNNRKIILFVRPGREVTRFSQKLPPNWSFRPIYFCPIFWSQLGLALVARFLKVDVIFSPSHALPLLFNKKTVYVLHGLEMKETPSHYSFFSRLINEWLLKKSLAKANKVLTVSATTLKKAVKFYGIDKKKMRVVYQGAKITKGKKLISQAKITPRIRAMVSQPYLIYVGNLGARKNIEGIIKAFNLIKEKQKNLKLLLLGTEGHGYSQIQQAINHSKWKQDIKKIGYVNKKEKDFLIQHAQCLICVSFSEGFGRTILEALTLNVPVVAAKIEVLLELYRDMVYFADPYNVQEIARAIEQALRERESKTELREKYSGQVKENYNWDKIAVTVGNELISFDKR